MQEEDTRLMIRTCLSMIIHERSKIKFYSNNDIYKTYKSDMHSNNETWIDNMKYTLK